MDEDTIKTSESFRLNKATIKTLESFGMIRSENEYWLRFDSHSLFVVYDYIKKTIYVEGYNFIKEDELIPIVKREIDLIAKYRELFKKYHYDHPTTYYGVPIQYYKYNKNIDRDGKGYVWFQLYKKYIDVVEFSSKCKVIKRVQYSIFDFEKLEKLIIDYS